MERLLSQVDQWASDHATALTPRREERPKGPNRFGTAYAVMVELERAQRESVDPATMARVFHHDTGLLLKAIRITEQRRREMRGKARRARDAGRARDEQVAQGLGQLLAAVGGGSKQLLGVERIALAALEQAVGVDGARVLDLVGEDQLNHAIPLPAFERDETL